MRNYRQIDGFGLNFGEQKSKNYSCQFSKKLPPQIQRTARRKLIYLDEADRIEDLRSPPGNRLKKLGADREGQWSIRINDQWRICFYWEEPDAYKVEITDYH